MWKAAVYVPAPCTAVILTNSPLTDARGSPSVDTLLSEFRQQRHIFKILSSLCISLWFSTEVMLISAQAKRVPQLIRNRDTSTGPFSDYHKLWGDMDRGEVRSVWPKRARERVKRFLSGIQTSWFPGFKSQKRSENNLDHTLYFLFNESI